MIHPGILLAGRQAEWNRGAEAERKVLANKIIGRGMTKLDGALLHSIECLKRRHNIACGEDANGELAISQFADTAREHLAAAIDRLQVLGKAGG